jgi:SET domain-containing protein
MQVEYDLRESKIAGLGLFAKARIPKGTLLWKYSEKSVREFSNAEEVRATLKTRTHDEVIFFLEHAYCWDDKVNEILDDGRYWNHSKSPNTGSLPEDEDSSFALRDIEAGEELLDDYSKHDMFDWYEAICKEHGVSSSSAVGVEFD